MRVCYTAKDITDMTDHSVNQGWSQISSGYNLQIKGTIKAIPENKLRPYILFFEDTLCTHKGDVAELYINLLNV
jgi:hypothetical protein